MQWNRLSVGNDVPNDINVVVEISTAGEPVKYEIDKGHGALVVDRILSTAMRYPGNYGFIPSTVSQDGDPLDVLIICDTPLVPGSVINCRTIGVLDMTDEAGHDEKIIAVPSQKVSRMFDSIHTLDDLPEYRLKQIIHFFENYKGLEPGKWVKVSGWGTREQAKALILAGMAAASSGDDAEPTTSTSDQTARLAGSVPTVLSEQARLMRAVEQGAYDTRETFGNCGSHEGNPSLQGNCPGNRLVA